jgi:hypothetical protein
MAGALSAARVGTTVEYHSYELSQEGRNDVDFRAGTTPDHRSHKSLQEGRCRGATSRVGTIAGFQMCGSTRVGHYRGESGRADTTPDRHSCKL